MYLRKKKKNKKNERMYLREFPGGLVAMARVHAWSGNWDPPLYITEKKKKKKDRENQLLNVILKLIFPLGFYFLTELWGLIIKCPLQNA